ncbi:MAG: CRISPR-associated endoribonuclease Cas6 [Candidatus Kapabacteria bacterium]|nr:CRISPR-associated endoribonuclease Cas6 [Candidatus Kapabacteria bacterium]
MRLYLSLTPTNTIVPFDYQYLLLGKFHDWLGVNEFHDKISLYSFGWLSGGNVKGKGIEFRNGANWFISFWDEEIGKKIIFNALKRPDFIYGMKVNEVVIRDTPSFTQNEKFMVSSPVLVREYSENKSAKHLTFDDKSADDLMTKTMQRKLSEVGLKNDIQIRFDRDYHKSKTKLIKINGIENRVNVCPIIIEGSPESIQFAWNVGVGHSTGSGFGALI